MPAILTFLFSKRKKKKYLYHDYTLLISDVPVDDDISIEISNAQALESSAVDIHVHVNRIYPKPNCTVAYKVSRFFC